MLKCLDKEAIGRKPDHHHVWKLIQEKKKEMGKLIAELKVKEKRDSDNLKKRQEREKEEEQK